MSNDTNINLTIVNNSPKNLFSRIRNVSVEFCARVPSNNAVVQRICVWVSRETRQETEKEASRYSSNLVVFQPRISIPSAGGLYGNSTRRARLPRTNIEFERILMAACIILHRWINGGTRKRGPLKRGCLARDLLRINTIKVCPFAGEFERSRIFSRWNEEKVDGRRRICRKGKTIRKETKAKFYF